MGELSRPRLAVLTAVRDRLVVMGERGREFPGSVSAISLTHATRKGYCEWPRKPAVPGDVMVLTRKGEHVMRDLELRSALPALYLFEGICRCEEILRAMVSVTEGVAPPDALEVRHDVCAPQSLNLVGKVQEEELVR